MKNGNNPQTSQEKLQVAKGHGNDFFRVPACIDLVPGGRND